MPNKKTSHLWIAKFAARLMAAEPTMPTGAAVCLAVRRYEFDAEQDADLAAVALLRERRSDPMRSATTPPAIGAGARVSASVTAFLVRVIIVLARASEWRYRRVPLRLRALARQALGK